MKSTSVEWRVLAAILVLPLPYWQIKSPAPPGISVCPKLGPKNAQRFQVNSSSSLLSLLACSMYKLQPTQPSPRPCDSPQRAPHFGHRVRLGSRSWPSPPKSSSEGARNLSWSGKNGRENTDPKIDHAINGDIVGINIIQTNSINSINCF